MLPGFEQLLLQFRVLGLFVLESELCALGGGLLVLQIVFRLFPGLLGVLRSLECRPVLLLGSHQLLLHLVGSLLRLRQFLRCCI